MVVRLSVIIILIPSATRLNETEALGTGAVVCYQVPMNPSLSCLQFIWRMFPNDSQSIYYNLTAIHLVYKPI